jgi:pyruvate dehydrogenase E1 component alpha subunit
MYHARLLAEGATEAQLVEIELAVAAQVDQATEEAKAGPIPGADLLMKDVWADGGSAWRN